jgi:hypothetical protein
VVLATAIFAAGSRIFLPGRDPALRGVFGRLVAYLAPKLRPRACRRRRHAKKPRFSAISWRLAWILGAQTAKNRRNLASIIWGPGRTPWQGPERRPAPDAAGLAAYLATKGPSMPGRPPCARRAHAQRKGGGPDWQTCASPRHDWQRGLSGDRSFNLAAVTAFAHQVGWSLAPVELAWDVRHSHPVPTALSDYDKFRRYTAFRPYLGYRHPEQSLQDSIARSKTPPPEPPSPPDKSAKYAKGPSGPGGKT